ncbi:hypothetical protein, partial [Comamonas aquatica]|uniref:hypothetical protein n=1 Tax=Comamonas aquatica TaxID=225991 RepID=UPI00391B0C2B
MLQGQTVKALRICDPASNDLLIRKQPGHAHFGAVALECERHALLCYCPMRYLLYPHGSVFGCFGGTHAALHFRASVCEVCDLEDWLPITAGAHWSHRFDRELPMRGDVLMESPQLVRDSQATEKWSRSFEQLSPVAKRDHRGQAACICANGKAAEYASSGVA